MMGQEEMVVATPRVTVHHRSKRRARFVINPAFQWKYTLAVMASVFVVSAMMTTMLFGTLYDQARARTLYMAVEHPWQNSLTVAFSAAGFATVMAVAFGLWSVVVTHRICGPLFVVSGFLRELADGRFPTRRALRKNDEFKEFYDEFWRTVDAMKARRQSEIVMLAQALELATANAGSSGREQDQRSAIEAIKAEIEGLQRQLNGARQESPVQTPAMGESRAQTSPCSES